MRKLENINKNKYERQLIGCNRWFNSSFNGSYKDKNGCLNYCTGVGKTFTTMLIIDRYLKEQPNSTIVILCPPHLIAQWTEVLKNTFYAKEIATVYIHSPEKLINSGLILNPALLIVDELDAFYSTQRMKLINKSQIKYQDLLGLTATYEDTKNIYLTVAKFCPIIDKIGETEAINKGWISKFIEYNLGLEFTPEEQEQHKKLSTAIREGLSKFGKGSLPLAMRCLSGGMTKEGNKHSSTEYCYNWAKYNGWRENLNPSNISDQETHNLWNPRMVFSYAVNLMRAIKARKDLIYNASNKLTATTEILENFKYTKTIIFSQSILFADLLYGIMNEFQPNNSVIYHSKIQTQLFPSEKTGKLIKHGKTLLKRRAINRLKNGSSKHLITSSVLDKGLDIPDVKIGITTSGTQNPTQAFQRGGRVKRKDFTNENGVVILINLYIKNSKEVTWLSNRQSTYKHIVYWIDFTNQISYKPQIKEEGINIKDI